MTQDSERAMLLYAQLASIAGLKQQALGRVRFLVLTGIAATRSGWLDVAARCHQLITHHAPRHLLTRYPSFAEALRNDDFTPFAKQTERFCPPERAEHLLTGMGLAAFEPDADHSAGERAMQALRDD